MFLEGEVASELHGSVPEISIPGLQGCTTSKQLRRH